MTESKKFDIKQVPLAGDIDKDDIVYEDWEYSELFEPALWLIMRDHSITGDSTMTQEESDQSSQLGVFEYSWSHWKIQLNWTSAFQGQIPPNHLAVYWRDQHVGTISPFQAIRICWKCRAGGMVKVPNIPGSRQLLKDAGLPEDAQFIPRVLPAHPCPYCKHSDWVGRMVSENDFQRACAEEVARRNNQPELEGLFQPQGSQA